MRKIGLSILTAMIMCVAPVMTVCAEGDLIPEVREIPDERLKPRLVDEADLLSVDEENELLKKLDEISERRQCDVAVVTANSMDGMWAQEFADDYFDYNGFGMGEDADGIVFLISMDEREWAFSTHGFAVHAFSDADLYNMEDEIIPYLSDGDYHQAFHVYADMADSTLSYGKTAGEGEYVGNVEGPYNEPDNYYVETETSQSSIVDVLILVPMSIIIGMIIAHFQKKRALKQYSGLIDNSRSMTGLYSTNMHLTKDDVRLVNRGVHRVYNPPKKSSSGGGSSVHRSSSGRSHGGRSGRF